MTSLTFVLLGATGDLAVKKIIPALQNLHASHALPDDFHVIAFSRRPWNHTDYHTHISPAPDTFLQHVTYVQGTFDDPQGFVVLKQKIAEYNAEQTIVHLAIQPEFYSQTIEQLAASDIISKESNTSLIIEKPFGDDEASAHELNTLLNKYISEKNIFRIDHYLGKENVRAMLAEVKRPEVHNKLDAYHVQKITVSLFEKNGIEGRGEFYDVTGVIKDVIQNHILELLAVALSDTSKSRADVLKALQLTLGATPSETLVLGQYQGYKDEEGVKQNSQTPTFASFRLKAQLPRWNDVPILIKAGKGMKENEVKVQFTMKDESKIIFAIQGGNAEPQTRDAYENLISEVIQNQKAFFTTTEEVLAEWHLIDQVMAITPEISVVLYPKHSNMLAGIE